ncbi:hypothetical protein [Alteribacillus bidgolensis]|uniref:Uncharacterized protein n=1 Tax=Alteribacillus bidgolensis TaxID=930129 RepID=A0A1G8PN37_9BACI|nr:hypothetical protein [Alteribacillus bidgolensis]SDI93883.1 hypothetical protein SAMN05216352_11545 [Alteribacillus bidgolensis]
MNKEELVELMQHVIERSEHDKHLTVETAVNEVAQEMKMCRKDTVS